MKLAEWNNDFALGLDGIDTQHRSLFDLINKIWQLIVDNADSESILQCLNELDHYTAVHFTAEEAFMQAIHYPVLPEHRQEHMAFIERIADERETISRGGQLTLDLVRFLQSWLINHIKTADRAYADFAQAGQNEVNEETGFHSLLGKFFARFR